MCAYLKERWEKPGSRYHVMKEMFDCLHKLEVLSADWPKKVRHYEKVLFGGCRKQYEALHQYRMPDKIAEQLLSYFIYVYFAGAVYDGMPYSKVKLAVISTMLIEDMSAPKQQKKVSFPLRQSLMPLIVTLGKSNTPTLISNACL